MAKCEGILAETGDGLSESERINLRLLKAELETFITGYDFKG
jgi:hypothetical protein